MRLYTWAACACIAAQLAKQMRHGDPPKRESGKDAAARGLVHTGNGHSGGEGEQLMREASGSQAIFHNLSNDFPRRISRPRDIVTCRSCGLRGSSAAVGVAPWLDRMANIQHPICRFRSRA